jgi:hypothetical protein
MIHLLRYVVPCRADARHIDIRMPRGARIRSVCWTLVSSIEVMAEVEPGRAHATRRLHLVRREEPVPKLSPFISTLPSPPEALAVYDGGEVGA